MKLTSWNRLIAIGRFVAAANRAGSEPDPLKCRWGRLSGIPKMLSGPHSKEWVAPLGSSMVVDPWPDST